MFDCWRFILCKKTGRDDCSSSPRSNEAKTEESDHWIDVPDGIRLVGEQREGMATPTGRAGFKPSFDPEALTADYSRVLFLAALALLGG